MGSLRKHCLYGGSQIAHGIVEAMIHDWLTSQPLWVQIGLPAAAVIGPALLYAPDIWRWMRRRPEASTKGPVTHHVHNHETISMSERVESKLIKPPGRMTRAFRALLRFFRVGTPREENPILLSDAMLRAWQMKEIRELPEFQTLARERPQDIYRRLAERIFDGRDPSLSIRGVIGEPPLDQIVESPHEYAFANDLARPIHGLPRI